MENTGNPAFNAADDNAEKTFDDPFGHVRFTPEECDEKLLQGIYQAASMFWESVEILKPKIKDQKLKDTIELECRGIDKIMDDAVRIMRSKKIAPKAPGIFARAAA